MRCGFYFDLVILYYLFILPITRRVKEYIRFVGKHVTGRRNKYVTGRRKRFRPHVISKTLKAAILGLAPYIEISGRSEPPVGGAF